MSKAIHSQNIMKSLYFFVFWLNVEKTLGDTNLRKHFRNYFSLTDIVNESTDIRKLIEAQLLIYPK